MDEKTNLVEVKLSFPLYCIANEYKDSKLCVGCPAIYLAH